MSGNPRQEDKASQEEKHKRLKENSGVRSLAEEKQKLIDAIEKDQIENKSFENISESELEEDSENPEKPDVYTENADSTTYGAETKGSSELGTEPDSRFSKDHTDKLDEQSLRKNKKETNTAPSGS